MQCKYYVNNALNLKPFKLLNIIIYFVRAQCVLLIFFLLVLTKIILLFSSYIIHVYNKIVYSFIF